ncbi:MFS transporter [Sporosalibacterium faouarense]|uniref:MFS transporter n=1 Tax=Sporosalibacterium faouarense TaxID=516123 RepID=UPI00192BF19D|nr:MFS transporter [Sporosalibacterium faouarense]
MLISKRENLNLSFFSIGMLISILGSAIYTFVIGLYVLKITESGMSFATTLMLNVIAVIIFNPIAGVVSDRFNKKRIVIIMDLLNGLMFIILFIVSKYNSLTFATIYISTFLTSGLTTIFGITFNTAKPNIVTDSKLLKINSVTTIIESLASIAGPAIGGMVFAFISIDLFILFNGVSFLISVIFESMIDFNLNKTGIDGEEENLGFFRDFKVGINYILSRKDVIAIVSLLIAINFFISLCITVPLPYIINQVLKLSSSTYGIVKSFFPIGMILGATIIKYIMKKMDYDRLLKIMTLGLATIILMIGIPLIIQSGIFVEYIYLIYYAICNLLFGLIVSFIDIPIIYFMQIKIPSNLRGRVLSIGMGGAKIIAPMALILSGLLLEHIEAYLLPLVGGGVLFIGTVFWLRGWLTGRIEGQIERKSEIS